MNISVSEIVAESNVSWKDAIQKAVNEASRSIPNVTGVEVYNLTADVVNGKVVDYKANIKLAYVDDGNRGEVL
ncbi:MAG: dodecin [Clostridia bacterium]|jgi:hypothetical protein|nr:dodecin [Clostridia bacterium]